MKLPELGSVWIDKSYSKQDSGGKVVVYKSDLSIVEYTYPDIDVKSNRSVKNFYRDFRPFDELYDYKRDCSSNRYFYISYSADGATGACTLTATKFVNHKEFRESMQERHPELRNVCIMGWNEMTEEEYLVFAEE